MVIYLFLNFISPALIKKHPFDRGLEDFWKISILEATLLVIIHWFEM